MSYLVVNNSIMVKSSESGVVEEVGVSLNGVKYIKIKHCLDVQSVIENVDIIGVQEGEIVKKGQDIATAVEGQKIVMKLYVQDVKLTNIELNQSKIVWES
jgi:DNA-binding protein